MGDGVIDSDYRGEIDVILFNFSEEEFCINMGDRIAQIIFEKRKTPSVKKRKNWETLTVGIKAMVAQESVQEKMRSSVNQRIM